jgi:hypothetical protein
VRCYTTIVGVAATSPMGAGKKMIPCLWCGRTFLPRRDGGRTQRFCGTGCRRALDAGLRAWTLAELAAGRITVDDIRNKSPATRALRMARSGDDWRDRGTGGDLVPRAAAPEFLEQYARRRAMAP